MTRFIRNTSKRNRAASGFTLIEFMVAMAIFMLISGVALRLFTLQQNSASLQKDQVGLNLSLRNAVTQMQIDISNAGSNYLQNVNIPNWPLGVSIVNNVVTTGNSCYDSTAKAYGYKCFDQVNIISAANPATYPALIVTSSSGGTNPSSDCSNTTNGIAYAQPATSAGLTAAQTAALFKNKDQLLLLKADASKLTTVVLKADASVSGSVVKFTFNATDSAGKGTNTSTNDPLNISTCGGTSNCSSNPPSDIAAQFCANDYLIKVTPISYIVCAGPGSPSPCDTSSTSPDIQDPKLERVTGGVASIVMEQVIGFKVGAAIFNTSTFKTLGIDTSSGYVYDASTYTNQTTNDVAYNFTTVRSVRASLIARTTPNYNGNYKFRNTFDQGPYQVQGISVVVNPRNMSMND